MPENNPFATNLRWIVFDALKLILEDGVPNANPHVGFQCVIEVPVEVLKLLKRGATKGWTKFGDNGKGSEIWMVPAWELLRFADEVDLASVKGKENG